MLVSMMSAPGRSHCEFLRITSGLVSTSRSLLPEVTGDDRGTDGNTIIRFAELNCCTMVPMPPSRIRMRWRSRFGKALAAGHDGCANDGIDQAAIFRRPRVGAFPGKARRSPAATQLATWRRNAQAGEQRVNQCSAWAARS